MAPLPKSWEVMDIQICEGQKSMHFSFIFFFLFMSSPAAYGSSHDQPKENYSRLIVTKCQKLIAEREFWKQQDKSNLSQTVEHSPIIIITVSLSEVSQQKTCRPGDSVMIYLKYWKKERKKNLPTKNTHLAKLFPKKKD